MMNKLIKFCKTLLLTAMIICGTSFLATRVDAATLEVANTTDNPIYVAAAYNYVLHDGDNNWFCQGWWKVEPNSVRDIKIANASVYVNDIYVHMHDNKGNSWGDEKYYTVINSAFKYKLKSGCPAGSNRRKVGFKGYYAHPGDDEVVYISTND